MADRLISDVIEQLLEVIPGSYTLTRERLKNISRDSSYKAPEIMHESWGDLSNALHSMFKGDRPSIEWEIRVCEIMTTKSRKELGLG